MVPSDLCKMSKTRAMLSKGSKHRGTRDEARNRVLACTKIWNAGILKPGTRNTKLLKPGTHFS